MNVDTAATALVRKHGAAEMAEALGMSVALINAKLDPNKDRNVLSLRDAMRMTDVSGDLRILQAWASAENCRVVPVDATSEGTLMSTLLEQNEHEGNFARVLGAAIADGVISDNEMRAIERAGGELQGVWLKLLRQLKAMQKSAPEVAP